jgi:hypothetical protein
MRRRQRSRSGRPRRRRPRNRRASSAFGKAPADKSDRAPGTAEAQASALLDFRNLGAERLEPIDQLAVTALDRFERRDACLAFGRQTRRNK